MNYRILWWQPFDPARDEQVDEVNKILKEIGADTIPQVLILNKIDLIDLGTTSKGCIRDEYDRISRIRLSAKTGEGIELVRQALTEAIAENSRKLYENSKDTKKVIGSCATVQELF